MSTQENGFMNKLNTICNRQGWKLEKDDPVQSGPKYKPVWTANVFGDPFQGTGPSIQAAREAAAQSAIEYYKVNKPEVVPSGF